MKKLILTEIKMMSAIEEKARVIKFHPKRTVIKGENHAGKSSLIKTILWTFGAVPPKIHPTWKDLDITSLVSFRLDKDKYAILRKGSFYAVFDKNNEILGTFSKVTSELAPFLADLFGYKIKLTDKKNELITPPPAYFLLPFYVDQDVSWSKNWNAFSNLGQLPSGWRNNIIKYHSGINTNRYYEIRAQIEKLKVENSEYEVNRKVSKSVLDKLLNQFRQVDLSFNLNDFQKEITELMESLEMFKQNGEILKQKIVKLETEKIRLLKQIKIVESTQIELQKDYEFLLKQDDEIDCPTCGQVYENSFSERFSIAQDEDECKELLVELNMQLKEITTQIDIEYVLNKQNNHEEQNIRKLLNTKQGEIKLQDVIQNEGKRELKGILEKEIREIEAEIGSIKLKIQDLQDVLKTVDNKKRQAEIKDFYFQKMRHYLYKLEIHKLAEKNFKSIFSQVQEGGSGQPRALLAYYYSILHTMHKYSDNTLFPIIIDSPNQQDQDADNIERIMEFIFEEQPNDTQLILGLVEYELDEKFDGKVIELEGKFQLLKENEYKNISRELVKLLEDALNY